MTILYVDDDPDDRQIFLEAVKTIDESFVCNTAKDGLDALTYLDSNTLPDVVFLDINMPLMNGKACLAEIKGNKNTSHVPVIIFTTSNNPQEKDECKGLGATDFVHKPISYIEMKDILTSIFITNFSDLT
ncbi:MAG: response regulator [Cyclobacteriaceae bacterium]